MILKRCSAGHIHWCPGCERIHILPDGWTFNGNPDRPNFTPSFKHTWNRTGDPLKCCHYIVTDGVLNFCGDSTHALAGKSVPIPPLPDRYLNFD